MNLATAVPLAAGMVYGGVSTPVDPTAFEGETAAPTAWTETISIEAG